MKIFCIGFNKTGTVSLYSALNQLGFKGIHGAWSNHKKVEKALVENKKLLHYFPDNFTHFSDLDIIKDNFKILDYQYPKSYFILNTRDRGKWLVSRRKHLEDYHKNMHNNKYAKTWEWVTKTEEEWLQEWDNHHTDVIDYFEGKKNLLVIDITSGDGYLKLCNFLGVPERKEAFPKLNVTINRR